MRSGPMDREIIIQQVSLADNSFGSSQVPTWSTFATVWAQVTPMKADERFVSAQKYASKVNKFRIRYLTGLLPTMRISYDGVIWKILGLSEMGRHDGHEILAESLS